MCGIVGLFNSDGAPVDAGDLDQMLATIVHRGPDDHGTFTDSGIGIGMRRLSIIDLAAGHQPIHNESRSVWVVLNGEIYNFAGLRAELEARGHRFYTSSDTETIVHLYEEHGDAFVEHLNGMFGIALWDCARRRLVLARDRVGEKQLYWTLKDGRFAFGSEIKCVLATGLSARRLDLAALKGYFTLLYAPAPATIFDDIHELPPAHYAVVSAEGITVRRYWDLQFRPEPYRNEQEWVEGFRRQFFETVRSRLVSDVPLGALLSGGIDSSAIVAAMAEAAAGPVKTYCIGYADDSSYYDERRYARLVAEKFATEHHELVVEPDIVDVIPKLVRAFDQPFADSSAIANYYVFQETRKHVKVVLSGLGGDEVAGGYERYVGLKVLQYYRALPAWLRRGVLERLAAALPESGNGARGIERFKRFVRIGALTDADAYLGYVANFGSTQRERLWSPEARSAVDDRGADRWILDSFNGPNAHEALNRALYTDLRTYLPGDLLQLTDRMSMAHSIEARAPFVDHRLLEFMAGVPVHLKIRGLRKKYLLKQAFRGRLPEEILHRRKQGFTLPLTIWFRTVLKSYLTEMLGPARLRATGLFDVDYVQRLMDEHFSLRENHHARLWSLVMFMSWYDAYKPCGYASTRS